MKKQGRFKHLFKPGNEHVLEYTQNFVDMELGKVVEIGGKHGFVRRSFLRMRHLFGAGNTPALAGVFFLTRSYLRR